MRCGTKRKQRNKAVLSTSSGERRDSSASAVSLIAVQNSIILPLGGRGLRQYPTPEGDAMTTISPKNPVITLINVFTVEPANQQRLIELLTEATEASVSRAPGFVSASLHRSTDGTKVTMYAQWRSIDEYQAMRRDPAPLPFLQEALKIARFEPGIYEVVRTFEPEYRKLLG
jgi:quinol monooxygenase YgiN